MKLLVNNNHNKVVNLSRLLKQGVSNKIIVYRRYSSKEEEYAILRKQLDGKVGFNSLIGPDYAPSFVGESYKEVLQVVCKIRNVYVFDSLEEFLLNKHKMKMYVY